MKNEMKPKTNGRERRIPKPRTPLLLWINPEKRKESEVFNRRNRYRLAFVIVALHMVASLAMAQTTDNKLFIVGFTFGLAWLAGWRSHIIIQWRK